jgi:hypothetical protein
MGLAITVAASVEAAMMKLRITLLALPVFCMPLVAAGLSVERKADATFDEASRARGWPQPRGELACTFKTDKGKVTLMQALVRVASVASYTPMT